MLDILCGSMRGGRRFVKYLEPGHYQGMDINPALLTAGRRELAKAGVADRQPGAALDQPDAIGAHCATRPSCRGFVSSAYVAGGEPLSAPAVPFVSGALVA